MKARVVPVDPLTTSQELRLKIPADTKGHEITLYLAAGDAGDGNAGDFVVWQQPRLVTPGRPDLLLRDVPRLQPRDDGPTRAQPSSAAKCLEAAAEASTASASPDVGGLARRHGVDRDALAAWLDYLGIGAGAPAARRSLHQSHEQLRQLRLHQRLGHGGDSAARRQLVGSARADSRQHEAAQRGRASLPHAVRRRRLAKPGRRSHPRAGRESRTPIPSAATA